MIKRCIAKHELYLANIDALPSKKSNTRHTQNVGRTHKSLRHNFSRA